MKALIAVAISFVIVGCSDVKEIILSKKDAVVLIVNNDKNGIGTGFFIDENLIITNYHVVEGGKGLEIKTETGNKFYPVEIIKSDQFADIATLKIKDWEDFVKNNKYSILKFNKNYNQLDEVYVIGHPWGLSWSMSKGVISAKSRLSPAPKFLLQTDAKVYQGNSGGPMLNTDGEVIAINSNMLSNEGGSYGLAIPYVIVEKVLKDLEKYDEVRWPVIGITLDSNIVKEVAESSPALKSGVKADDKIVAIKTKKGEFEVNSAEELITRMAVNDYEDTVILYIVRNGEDITIEVKPDYKPSSSFKTDLTKK